MNRRVRIDGETQMPTYDYLCQECGHAFEKLESITAQPMKKCPDCGKNKLKRLIGSGSGIIFKGSGFYETDYKKKSGTGPSQTKQVDSDSGSDSQPKPASTDSGKSESKKETPKSDKKPA